LFAYAYAKGLNGKFILRIEDTDRKRYVEGSVESLINILKKFGIDWDEGPGIGGPYSPYIQSERLESGGYRKLAEKLVSQGNAYYCFCEAQTKEEIEAEHEDNKAKVRDVCRNLTTSEVEQKIAEGKNPAIRLKVPDSGEVAFYDYVLKKDIKWDLRNVDEAMLLKSDGYPTYHLGVVVDDVEMEITHIIRGFEWLSSTPIHLLLFKYLNYKVPSIGHFSLILDPDGGKLSKRKGNVAVEDFLRQGYLPEAILNFIMLLGWAPKDNREIFSLSEFVKEFHSGNLQIANAVFNTKKLDWFNGYYIRQKSDKELFELLNPFLPESADEKVVMQIIPLIKDRLVKLSDFPDFAGFFFEYKKPEKGLFGENYKNHLQIAVDTIKSIDEFSLENLNTQLMKAVKDNNFKTGDFFMDLRVAIAGSKFTPPINESMVILGGSQSIDRIEKALKL